MENLENVGGLSEEKSRERAEALNKSFQKSTEGCEPEDVEYFIDYLFAKVVMYIDESNLFNLQILIDKGVEDLCGNPRFVENVELKKLDKEAFLEGLRIIITQFMEKYNSDQTQEDSPELRN